jgi:hypothetical protein
MYYELATIDVILHPNILTCYKYMTSSSIIENLVATMNILIKGTNQTQPKTTSMSCVNATQLSEPNMLACPTRSQYESPRSTVPRCPEQHREGVLLVKEEEPVRRQLHVSASKDVYGGCKLSTRFSNFI